MSSELPTGTVTFLFTDIEGSTRLLQELADDYTRVLADHHRALRVVWARHHGVEVGTAGDAFFVAFARATDAVAAARDAQLALASGPVRIRIGVHTGEPELAVDGYVGLDVHRAARIAAAGHGGQVLLSQATVDLAGDDVRDLGLHRMKDLGAPERLFQLGTRRFPPLKTLQETNLPIPATPFLGRERGLAEIAELLQRPQVRLVTLTGAGGSGKTRLALQAAALAADDYPHGVWWVSLAPVTDHALVGAVAAQALGSKDALPAAIGDQRLLMLLDNFEHVLDAAPVVAETIATCPRLTVLVTSREPLHVDGEWEVPVDPLLEREAVELFVQRAAAVHADASSIGEVTEVCRRVDFLPLAVELAAARAKAVSLATLLERLDQTLPLLAGGSRSAPERQRTLRATIAWSHDLLTVKEQELFARLAVFSGGCTLDAAEEICDADIDSVSSLVDKSLLRRTGDRYWMLETIREFATEQLAELGDVETLHEKHAAWYLALGERAQPELRARRMREWLDRLAADHANIRAALDHFLARREAKNALRLCGAIWLYWQTRGHWTEGRRAIADTIALAEDAEPEELVEALWGGGLLALWQGDANDASAKAEQLEALSESSRDWAWAAAHHIRGLTAGLYGDQALARVLLEESVDLARRGEDGWLLSITLNNLGNLDLQEGNYQRAIELFEESLAVGQAFGDHRRARQLINLGRAAFGLGQTSRAEERLRAGLVAAEQLGDVEAELAGLFGLAACGVESGDAVNAARLLGWEQSAGSRLGGRYQWRAQTLRDETLALLRDALGAERLEAELETGSLLTHDEAVRIALRRTE